MFVCLSADLPSLLDEGSLQEGVISYPHLFPRIEHKLIVILNRIVSNAAALRAHPNHLDINQFFILQVFIENPEYQNPECSLNELIHRAWMGTLRLL